MGYVPMLFTTHVNIAALAQNKQSQTGKHCKSNHNFPHSISFKKKGSHEESPINTPARTDRGVHSLLSVTQSLA